MNRRFSKRAERHAATNRAAAEERRATAAQRAAAEEERAAVAAAAAAAAAPLLAAGPAVAAPAVRERQGPTSEQLYKSLWSKPNLNHVAADKVKGRQGLPLPARAPVIEITFFKLRKEDKTGNALVDILMEEIYDDCFNDIGDKRREILHCVSQMDEQKELRLSADLKGLMLKANKQVKELFDRTGHLINLPEYFLHYPALNK